MVNRHDASEPRPAWVRPLVRYVDETQAVIETHVFLRKAPAMERLTRGQRRRPLDVLIRLEAPDGRVREHRTRLEPDALTGVIRFELRQPERWWPAGMGEQVLYQLTVTISSDDMPLDDWQTTIGLTSVRPVGNADDPTLLVNGRECAIQRVVTVDPDDEQQVLAVGTDSLLVVRDHFAPDELFEAADRTGLLLIQAVPRVEVDPRADIPAQVDRLAAHPSLAGWLITEPDEVGDHIAGSLRSLDPTRSVFRRWPLT